MNRRTKDWLFFGGMGATVVIGIGMNILGYYRLLSLLGLGWAFYLSILILIDVHICELRRLRQDNSES